jgi:hypothetical protein
MSLLKEVNKLSSYKWKKTEYEDIVCLNFKTRVGLYIFKLKKDVVNVEFLCKLV